MPRKVKVKNTNKNTNINKISIHLSEIKKRRRAKRNAKIQSKKQQQPIQQPVQFYQQPLKMSIPVQMPIVRGVPHQTTPIIDALSVPQNQYKTTQLPGVQNVEFLDEQRKQLEQHKKDTEEKLLEHSNLLENYNKDISNLYDRSNYLIDRDTDTRKNVISLHQGALNKFNEQSNKINDLYNISNTHLGHIKSLNSGINDNINNINTLDSNIKKLRSEGQGATIHLINKIDDINNNVSNISDSLNNKKLDVISTNPLLNINPEHYKHPVSIPASLEYKPNALIEKSNNSKPLSMTDLNIGEDVPVVNNEDKKEENIQDVVVDDVSDDENKVVVDSDKNKMTNIQKNFRGTTYGGKRPGAGAPVKHLTVEEVDEEYKNFVPNEEKVIGYLVKKEYKEINPDKILKSNSKEFKELYENRISSYKKNKKKYDDEYVNSIKEVFKNKISSSNEKVLLKLIICLKNFFFF